MGRGVGGVVVEGVEGDAEVAEAVEAVGADAAVIALATELVGPGVGVYLDGDLGVLVLVLVPCKCVS